MKNYVQPGDTLTVTAPYDLNPGDGCQVGVLFGVSNGKYLSGDTTVELETEGVYDLTALSTDVASGSTLVPAYWDNTNKRVTISGAGNLKIGSIIKAKANGDTTARVRLDEAIHSGSLVTLNAYMADAGTASSAFVVCPFAGNIVGLAAVSSVANATAATTLLAKLGGVTVTAPAWTFTTTQAAGLASAVVPTAANAVAAGGVIELNSDGGSSSVMPTMFTVTIQRTN